MKFKIIQGAVESAPTWRGLEYHTPGKLAALALYSCLVDDFRPEGRRRSETRYVACGQTYTDALMKV